MPEDDRPSEPDTAPEIGILSCPACYGQRRTLRVTETPTGHRAQMRQCALCEGVGMISKPVYEAWIASKKRERS